jgi:hypothetical protein
MAIARNNLKHLIEDSDYRKIATILSKRAKASTGSTREYTPDEAKAMVDKRMLKFYLTVKSLTNHMIEHLSGGNAPTSQNAFNECLQKAIHENHHHIENLDRDTWLE